MTLPKSALPLVEKAKACGKSVQVAYVSMGHHQMTESPDETLALCCRLHW